MSVPKPIMHAVGSLERQKDKLGHAFRKRVGYFNQIRVVSYNGYANDERLFMKGRVLADDKVQSVDQDTDLDNLVNMFRRYRTDEVPKASVRATVGEREFDVQTDWEGYFDLEVDPGRAMHTDELWVDVDLELLGPKPRVEQPTFEFDAQVQAPSQAEIGIISDIDDTIVETGATGLLRQARVVLLNGPRTRVPFPGVASFYRALQRERGVPTNPIWYVSSSPWNLYELFVEFMEFRDIPAGSIFLKDFGFDRDKFIKSGHEEYKIDHIERLLDAYPDMRFVLIGDSGQKDPEIYHHIVRNNPDRIAAVYLRDVTDEARGEEVAALAADAKARGVDMLLVEDTLGAAKHAHDLDLIDRTAIDRVRNDCQRSYQRPKVPRSKLSKAAGKLRDLMVGLTVG